MNADAVRSRIDALLEKREFTTIDTVGELISGTTTLMQALYGPDSPQLKDLRSALDSIRRSPNRTIVINDSAAVVRGALRNLRAEVDAGLLGTLQARITGEVLSDFVALARAVLADTNEGAKNVGSVLAAAAFEDALRRLACGAGIPHKEKLADVHTALKEKDLLTGAQVGIAQSYLNFRNRALHAQWDTIDRPEAHSVLAFVEQLLLKHFS